MRNGVARRLRRAPRCSRAARARPALLQRELCARSGARAPTPLPLAAAWARPPGRGSRPRRQRLPAWRPAPPRVHPYAPAGLQLARRRSPHPASPAASYSPRRPAAMLSFQYPDVYRDETSVSTLLSPHHPARAARSPAPPAAPRPCAPRRSPAFVCGAGRGRRTPPSARLEGGRNPRAGACLWSQSLGLKDRPWASMGAWGRWAERAPAFPGGAAFCRKYGGRAKGMCVLEMM